jgi:hypothetical protein
MFYFSFNVGMLPPPPAIYCLPRFELDDAYLDKRYDSSLECCDL